MFENEIEVNIREMAADILYAASLIPNKCQICKFMDNGFMVVIYKDIKGRLYGQIKNGKSKQWSQKVRLET